MFLDYTTEQKELRQQLRQYFARLLPDDVRTELGGPGEGGPLYRRLVRQMGADGWLGIGWPKEHGGQGRPPTDQFIFFDEAQRAGAPIPFVTLHTAGPTIRRCRPADQTARVLPGTPGAQLI